MKSFMRYRPKKRGREEVGRRLECNEDEEFGSGRGIRGKEKGGRG